ncbi:hypothetical protein QLX08_000392 [Tetragonisca angustula]|uniref:Uncharacterized protein n=1 Tax=Tetragonisca angustula TaxID=166442 RepID=A0AAW1AJU0_9HYME
MIRSETICHGALRTVFSWLGRSKAIAWPLARLSHGFTSRSAVVILRPFIAFGRGTVAVDWRRSSVSSCDNGLAGSARKVNLSCGTRHLINSRPTMEEPFVVSRESYLLLVVCV